MKLEIDLGREETLSAVRLELAYPHDQFPRDLTLKVRTEGGAGFERIEHRDDRATKWELVEALVEEPSSAAVVLRFPPTKARCLRFWIREGKEWDFSLPDWSLPELHLYRECARPSLNVAEGPENVQRLFVELDLLAARSEIPDAKWRLRVVKETLGLGLGHRDFRHPQGRPRRAGATFRDRE